MLCRETGDGHSTFGEDKYIQRPLGPPIVAPRTVGCERLALCNERLRRIISADHERERGVGEFALEWHIDRGEHWRSVRQGAVDNNDHGVERSSAGRSICGPHAPYDAVLRSVHESA